MRARWRNLELPSRALKDEEVSNDNYGKFVIEPFERGFGHTLGNSLRRVLLSSLEGSSVTSVRIKGVDHEFTTIKGVLEDVFEIILNIKSMVVKLLADEPHTIILKSSKKGPVTAGMIEADPQVEIAAPDHLIATITGKTSLEIEMEVKKGRGYITAEENAEEGNPIGVIPIDSIFSPVRRVRYLTEDTRVGQRTNYDKLILEIWTNGVITPEEALVESGEILRKHLNPFVHYFRLGEELQSEPLIAGEELGGIEDDINMVSDLGIAGEEMEIGDETYREKMIIPITDLELSIRASNCLQQAGVQRIADLIKMNSKELLEIKNFGRTSLVEIAEKLKELGLSLRDDKSQEESE